MALVLNGSNDTITGLQINSANIVNGSIVNDDINASAAIAGTKISGGVGKIVQVLQDSFTSNASTSSTTYQDTGLSQSITPSSSSNKILVMYSLYMSCVNGTYSGMTTILRGSTEIFIGDAYSSAQRVTTHHWPTSGYPMALQSHTFLDTPGSGTHTYKVQYKAGYAGYSIYIGRSQQGATSAHAGMTPSSLTLFEVTA